MENRTTIQLSEELRKDLKILAAKRDMSYQELLEGMISIFKELSPNKTIITIPKLLAEKVKSKIKHTDIDNVSEYVTFLLRTILSEKEGMSSKQEEDIIKKRLKNLGYL